MDEEKKGIIKIILTPTETGYSSTHELYRVDPLAAAVILMDVARDLFLETLKASRHHHKEESNGH